VNKCQLLLPWICEGGIAGVSAGRERASQTVELEFVVVTSYPEDQKL
jgi:hypothetical protein